MLSAGMAPAVRMMSRKSNGRPNRAGQPRPRRRGGPVSCPRSACTAATGPSTPRSRALRIDSTSSLGPSHGLAYRQIDDARAEPPERGGDQPVKPFLRLKQRLPVLLTVRDIQPLDLTAIGFAGAGQRKLRHRPEHARLHVFGHLVTAELLQRRPRESCDASAGTTAATMSLSPSSRGTAKLTTCETTADEWMQRSISSGLTRTPRDLICLSLPSDVVEIAVRVGRDQVA